MAPKDRDYQPGELVPGTVYQVSRVLARGGMGTVYDVEDTTIGKRYVLKTLHPQLGDRADLARRMQAEARTLARLHHPNIVEVVTAGVTSDDLRLPFFVMERLSGQNLRVVLHKKAALELPHAYHIAIDLLDALDHAHDKGVIHRDVKPENIFLHRTASGTTVTKLLDFGIMTMLDGGRGETGGRFLGTLRYASPEQLRGETPSPRMDLYAASLVLYEMVAGRGPFDDESDMHKVAAAHLHKRAPPISQFVQVPLALDSLLRSALDKDINARPRDAFSFAAQLRNLKRALAGGSLDGTENRDTAAAVMSRIAARAVPIRVQEPLLPASPVSPLASSSASVNSNSTPNPGPISFLPKSTLHGMPVVPVSGGTLENAPASHASSSPATPSARVPMFTAPMSTIRSPSAPPGMDPVDRLAPTGSMHAEVPRQPVNGTVPIDAFSRPLTPTPPPVDVADAVARRWVNAERSESGQVRTLTPGKDLGLWKKLTAVGALVVITAVLAAVGGFFVWKRMAKHPLAVASTGSAATSSSASPEVAPTPGAHVEPAATVTPAASARASVDAGVADAAKPQAGMKAPVPAPDPRAPAAQPKSNAGEPSVPVAPPPEPPAVPPRPKVSAGF